MISLDYINLVCLEREKRATIARSMSAFNKSFLKFVQMGFSLSPCCSQTLQGDVKQMKA